MFGRRDRQADRVAQRQIINQFLVTVLVDQALEKRVGLDSPIQAERRIEIAGGVSLENNSTQVMHHISAAENEHAFLPEGSQFFCQSVMR